MMIARIIAIASASVAISPIAGKVDAHTLKRDGSVTLLVEAERNMHDGQGAVDTNITQLVATEHSQLPRFNAAKYRKTVGAVAESSTVSPDGSTYSFKLGTEAQSFMATSQCRQPTMGSRLSTVRRYPWMGLASQLGLQLGYDFNLAKVIVYWCGASSRGRDWCVNAAQ